MCDTVIVRLVVGGRVSGGVFGASEFDASGGAPDVLRPSAAGEADQAPGHRSGAEGGGGHKGACGRGLEAFPAKPHGGEGIEFV